MKPSVFKRIKHGHRPGDVSKNMKIDMREENLEFLEEKYGVPAKAIKTYRKMLTKKGNRRIRHESTRSIVRHLSI